MKSIHHLSGDDSERSLDQSEAPADVPAVAKILKDAIARYRRVFKAGDVEKIQSAQDHVRTTRDTLSEAVDLEDDTYEPLFQEAGDILKPREEKIVRKFYRVQKKSSPLKWNHGV